MVGQNFRGLFECGATEQGFGDCRGERVRE
jgi:hypothetical protein